jgi:hypothetical protein
MNTNSSTTSKTKSCPHSSANNSTNPIFYTNSNSSLNPSANLSLNPIPYTYNTSRYPIATTYFSPLANANTKSRADINSSPTSAQIPFPAHAQARNSVLYSSTNFKTSTPAQNLACTQHISPNKEIIKIRSSQHVHTSQCDGPAWLTSERAMGIFGLH